MNGLQRISLYDPFFQINPGFSSFAIAIFFLEIDGERVLCWILMGELFLMWGFYRTENFWSFSRYLLIWFSPYAGVESNIDVWSFNTLTEHRITQKIGANSFVYRLNLNCIKVQENERTNTSQSIFITENF